MIFYYSFDTAPAENVDICVPFSTDSLVPTGVLLIYFYEDRTGSFAIKWL